MNGSISRSIDGHTQEPVTNINKAREDAAHACVATLREYWCVQCGITEGVYRHSVAFSTWLEETRATDHSKTFSGNSLHAFSFLFVKFV